MNSFNMQGNTATANLCAGGPTRFSKRIAKKPQASNNENEGIKGKAKGVKNLKVSENNAQMPSKGMKRSSSAAQLATRKRTALGDVTNAIQSHANRITQARNKKDTEKSTLKKPAQGKHEAVGQLKRTSNRLRRSKSAVTVASSSAFTICADAEPCAKPTDVEMPMQETLASLLGPTTSEDMNTSIVPEGLDPFDETTDPDHVCEYAHSIFRNMRKREAKYPISDYFLQEGRMSTGTMRAILVDWLVEVQENFQLYHETLYVAVKLLDMYLEKHDTPKEVLQLVGASSLLIACKMEEQQPPPVDDFQYICDDAYTSKMFLDMEIRIMKALNFDINIPISYRYLRRFSRVTQMGMEILTLSRFILELSLQEAVFVHVPPSRMAAACLCLAMKMKHVGEWNVNHEYHSGYKEHELVDLMRDLNNMVVESSESKLKNVRTKYSHPVHFAVAATKPLPSDAFVMPCSS